MLRDYPEILKNIQKKIGSQFLKDPSIFNVPGQSVACKIDPFYYLAIYPGFFVKCAEWTGIFPETIKETLIKTGNIVLSSTTKKYILEIKVKWESLTEPITLNGFFLISDFIDQSIKIYGRKNEILPVSNLKIVASEKPKLISFLKGKTPINPIAFE